MQLNDNPSIPAEEGTQEIINMTAELNFKDAVNEARANEVGSPSGNDTDSIGSWEYDNQDDDQVSVREVNRPPQYVDRGLPEHEGDLGHHDHHDYPFEHYGPGDYRKHGKHGHPRHGHHDHHGPPHGPPHHGHSGPRRGPPIHGGCPPHGPPPPGHPPHGYPHGHAPPPPGFPAHHGPPQHTLNDGPPFLSHRPNHLPHHPELGPHPPQPPHHSRHPHHGHPGSKTHRHHRAYSPPSWEGLGHQGPHGFGPHHSPRREVPDLRHDNGRENHHQHRGEKDWSGSDLSSVSGDEDDVKAQPEFKGGRGRGGGRGGHGHPSPQGPRGPPGRGRHHGACPPPMHGNVGPYMMGRPTRGGHPGMRHPHHPPFPGCPPPPPPPQHFAHGGIPGVPPPPPGHPPFGSHFGGFGNHGPPHAHRHAHAHGPYGPPRHHRSGPDFKGMTMPIPA